MLLSAHLCDLLICIVISAASGVKEKDRLIITDEGLVQGYLAKDGEYFAFLGIPYAAPPTHNNRFQAPKPAKPRETIFIANRRIECPQRDSVEEDCLVINVFTPVYKPGKLLLPVLFYIHGGAFLVGRGPTDGLENLINKNIIVVTFNYRLGALGFLCLGTEFAPGNAGLKDQVAALKWVRKNIRSFGGDKNQITVYGTSAGASSAELLILFKNDKNKTDLFQRAILESGSALNVWAVNDDPIATATAVYLNLSKKAARKKKVPISELEKFYQSESVLDLNKKTWDHYTSVTDGTYGFAVCIENTSIKRGDPIVTVHPKEKIYDHDYEKVPLMMLYTTLEGLCLTNEEFYTRNNANKIQRCFKDYLPANLEFESKATRNKVAEQIKVFYFGYFPVSIYKNNAWLNYLGDSLIMHGMITSLDQHSLDNNVYLMEFSYKNSMGSCDPLFDNVTAAGHGDIKQFAIFNSPKKTEYDKLTVIRVTDFIGNFVKSGNPTPYTRELTSVLWPPVDRDRTYLRLDEYFHILENPYLDRYAFWDQIYQDYGKKLNFNNKKK